MQAAVLCKSEIASCRSRWQLSRTVPCLAYVILIKVRCIYFQASRQQVFAVYIEQGQGVLRLPR